MPASVEPTYVHRDKRIVPGALLQVGGHRLKWYGIGTDDLPVPAESARCNCGSSATICTMVLGLDIDAGGTRRVLFDDASSGHVRFSQSL